MRVGARVRVGDRLRDRVNRLGLGAPRLPAGQYGDLSSGQIARRSPPLMK